MQLRVAQFDIDIKQVIGAGADGQIVRAQVVDDQLEQQLCSKYTWLPKSKVQVFIKLYRDGIK